MEMFLSLWKLDEPIGRLKFLLNNILIVVIMIVLTAPFYAILAAPNGTKGPLAIILGLVSLYLSFINIAKRFWDLTGRKMQGVWFSVGYFVAMMIPIINGILALAAFITLFFIAGRGIDEDAE